LSVSASGVLPPAYEWFEGESGMTAVPVTGGDGASIRVPPARRYWVRITNRCGAALSAAVGLTEGITSPRRRSIRH
jgi:hypothetical protein